MVDITTEIQIARPRHLVAAFAANPDNVPQWYVNIKSVKWKTAKPLEVGSQIAFIAQFLGRELAYTYHIAEFIEGEKLVMRTSEGPFPMETTYIWESVDANTTKMKLINRGEPAGFSKLVAPFMGIMMKKANRDDLKKLKTILELKN